MSSIIRLFVFEILSNSSNLSGLKEIILKLRLQKDNNIITLLIKKKNSIPKKIFKIFDKIYYCNSKNKLYKIWNKTGFIYDKLIHIIYPCYLNIENIISHNTDKLVVSDDKYNSLVRIYPYQLLKCNENLLYYINYLNFLKFNPHIIDTTLLNNISYASLQNLEINLFNYYSKVNDFFMNVNRVICGNSVISDYLNKLVDDVAGEYPLILGQFKKLKTDIIYHYTDNNFISKTNPINDSIIICGVKDKNIILDISKYLHLNEDFKQERNIEDTKVAIIMTCYNSELTVGLALKSLINQTYKNLEILVIDDCSIDKTIDEIKKYAKIDKRIKLFYSKINKGTYYCKNYCLKQISKDVKYIAFQDSDDISYPKRIEMQVNEMKSNNLLMSTCLSILKKNITLPLVSMVIDVNLITSLGYFNTNRFGSDCDYILRFFKKYVYNYDWNIDLVYKKNKGFFKDYKYYKNLKKTYYNIYRDSLSLNGQTADRKRKYLSGVLINKYKRLKNTNKLFYPYECHTMVQNIKIEYDIFEKKVENFNYIENNYKLDEVENDTKIETASVTKTETANESKSTVVESISDTRTIILDEIPEQEFHLI